MADIFNAVKHIVETVLENYGLADSCIGTVVSTSPVRIKISDRITLYEEQILLTEPAVREPLAPGDRVVMISVQREQKYIVIGREV